MLVGKSQTLELHRADAGCAVLQNFLVFVIEVCVDASGGRKCAVSQPLQNLLYGNDVYHYQIGVNRGI